MSYGNGYYYGVVLNSVPSGIKDAHKDVCISDEGQRAPTAASEHGGRPKCLFYLFCQLEILTEGNQDPH